MHHQTAFPLTERQEWLADAMRSFPKDPGESLKRWPEGYRLYEALQNLKDILNVPGRFLYSDISTLRSGEFPQYYLLGINPDVDISKNPALKTEIQEWSAKCSNAYLDESWDYRGRPIDPGTHLIQSRVQELCNTIVGKGLDASTRQVCASNLVFCRSESEAAQVVEADVFWPVHKAVLRIVNPACILVMGSGKAFEKIRKLLGFSVKDSFLSGHGSCLCYVAESDFQDGQPKLIGMPQFSRFKLPATHDGEKSMRPITTTNNNPITTCPHIHKEH